MTEVTLTPAPEPINYFPNSLRFNTLQYCSNVLLHMRTREDLKDKMGTIGETLLPLLSQFRSVQPQYLDEYYEMLSGICARLITFAGLCESASKSGAYLLKRKQEMEACMSMINALEAQPDLIKFLRNMHRQSPA